MPFTSREMLATDLTEEQIKALIGDLTEAGEEEEPEENDGDEILAAALAQVDSLIKASTGIEPEDEDHPEVLVSIANKIVIWWMSGRQSNLSDQELQRRKQNFDWAMEQLRETDWSAFADDDDDADLSYGSDTPRTGNW